MSAESIAHVSYVRFLAAEAVRERGIPASLAAYAARITTESLLERAPDRISRRRVRDYFWGVIRRRCLRGDDDALAPTRARYVLESIRSDLKASGRSREQIDAELLEHHRDLVDACAETQRQLAFTS